MQLSNTIDGEMGSDRKLRPCVVISRNDINHDSDGITVVPLTGYWDEKEDCLGRCAVTVAPYKTFGIEAGLIVSPQPAKDSKVETKSAEFGNLAEYVSHLERQLRMARDQLAAASESGPWKKSLINCAGPWTVNAVDDERSSRYRLNDVEWNRERARLSPVAMFHIDCAVQLLLSTDVRLLNYGQRTNGLINQAALRYHQGDVLRMKLPSGASQLCVVVSSTSIDFLRSKAPSPTPGKDSELITVVPLISAGKRGDTTPKIKHGKSELLALCQEVWTVYWRDRESQPEGDPLPPSELAKVHRGLRWYLRLPLLNER